MASCLTAGECAVKSNAEGFNGEIQSLGQASYYNRANESLQRNRRTLCGMRPMPQVQCNGQELHYADAGAGPPVVFLTGLGGDHLYWMGQIQAFANQYRCLALDNRDSGQSSYASAPYAVHDLADDVASVLQT